MTDCSLFIVWNSNTWDAWHDAKCRANTLRKHRGQLHPGLAAELAELERAGY